MTSSVSRAKDLLVKLQSTFSYRISRLIGALCAGLAFVVAFACPSFAASVLQPGATIGVPIGAPLPGGLYFIDTSSYGERSAAMGTGQNVNLPCLVLATPIYFYDTRLQFIALQPTNYYNYPATPTKDVLFLNSTLLAAQLAHTFGNGFGASYMAGLRVGMGAPQAYSLN